MKHLSGAQAALDCGRPAVIDIAIDPAALYRFRRDSFSIEQADRRRLANICMNTLVEALTSQLVAR